MFLLLFAASAHVDANLSAPSIEPSFFGPNELLRGLWNDELSHFGYDGLCFGNSGRSDSFHLKSILWLPATGGGRVEGARHQFARRGGLR